MPDSELMQLCKDDWTHLAEGARANGWAMCLPNYSLAPDARISAMTQQMVAAVTKAASLVSGPIAISGHSAGGHLDAFGQADGAPRPVLHPLFKFRQRQTGTNLFLER